MSKEEKAKEYVNELYMQTSHLFKERGIAREGYLSGYTAAEQDLSSQLAAYKEALREIYEIYNQHNDKNYVDWFELLSEKITKAKTLIE